MSALWTAAELRGVFGVDVGCDVSGISIDTRTLAPGDLFVALQGERDGHEFVEAAFAKGAAAALVSRPVPGNVIVVRDTLKALERLGAAARVGGENCRGDRECGQDHDQGNAAAVPGRVWRGACGRG